MQHSKSSRKKQQKASRNLRWLVLLVILGLSTTIGLIHQIFRHVRTINVDQLCPFGAVESLYSYIRTGQLLPRIGVSSFILMAFVLLSTILFRRSFCGLFCPLGALQEIFDRLGKKIFKKRFIMPVVIDRPMRWGKYLVLIVFVAFSWYFGRLVIRPFDPWAAYHHLASDEILTEFLIGFMVLVLSLSFSMFFQRIFCKYLCPLGAFIAFLAPLGMTAIERNTKSCTQCLACDKVCPVNIQVSRLNKVTSLECIQCQECVNVCPEAKTLELKISGKKKLYPNQVLAIVLGIFIVLVGSTSLTGDFRWMQPNLVKQAEKAQQRGAILNPENITGRMNFQEVSKAYGIPLEAFQEHFNFTEDESLMAFKDLKAIKGYETEEVRAFIVEYMAKQKP
jgi:ferredoxin